MPSITYAVVRTEDTTHWPAHLVVERARAIVGCVELLHDLDDNCTCPTCTQAQNIRDQYK